MEARGKGEKGASQEKRDGKNKRTKVDTCILSGIQRDTGKLNTSGEYKGWYSKFQEAFEPLCQIQIFRKSRYTNTMGK